MGNFYTNAVRHPEDIGVGHIRRTVSAGASGFDAVPGIPIGALEAGAIPLRASAYIETLFNGTTPTITLGTAANVDGLATSAQIAPATAGNKGEAVLLGGASPLYGIPLAVNTIFYVKLTQTNTTAGKITAIIEFVNKRENEGIPFPNN
jgi:hypothetical protein